MSETKRMYWMTPNGMRAAQVPVEAVPFGVGALCMACGPDDRTNERRVVSISWAPCEYECEGPTIEPDRRKHPVPPVSLSVDGESRLLVWRGDTLVETLTGETV